MYHTVPSIPPLLCPFHSSMIWQQGETENRNVPYCTIWYSIPPVQPVPLYHGNKWTEWECIIMYHLMLLPFDYPIPLQGQTKSVYCCMESLVPFFVIRAKDAKFKVDMIKLLHMRITYWEHWGWRWPLEVCRVCIYQSASEAGLTVCYQKYFMLLWNTPLLASSCVCKNRIPM